MEPQYRLPRVWTPIAVALALAGCTAQTNNPSNSQSINVGPGATITGAARNEYNFSPTQSAQVTTTINLPIGTDALRALFPGAAAAAGVAGAATALVKDQAQIEQAKATVDKVEKNPAKAATIKAKLSDCEKALRGGATCTITTQLTG